MLRAYTYFRPQGVTMIGPNCPGVLSPGKANVGIIPAEIFSEGAVGLVSRSGTLTYQIGHELTQLGLGNSTIVGIGGDPVVGSSFIDVLAKFQDDPQTELIVMVGEIGGDEEEKAAAFIGEHVTKPVLSYIAGFSAPPGKTMGHAGAIISGSSGTAQAKKEALEAKGIEVGTTPTEVARDGRRPHAVAPSFLRNFHLLVVASALVRSVWIAPALLAAAAVGASSSSSAPAPDAAWLAFGHDAQITGSTPAPAFTSKVKGFKLAWQAKLDGGVMASPLAAPVAGQGLVVFASTAKGNVYAVRPNGTVLWQRSLGTVVSDGNCGTYGINSTGAIDTKRGLLYVVGATGMLHALRLTDGTEAAGWPVRVVTRTRSEYVWGGLRLVGDRLYVPVASYCDAPNRRGVPAEGRLFAYDVGSPATARASFDAVPGPNNLGGIWGWGGVAATTDGDALYTGIGNAEPDVDNGYSDSMVELTPDLSEVVASDRPESAVPGQDTDLGAAPALFRPQGCPALLAANAKSGELLVWRQQSLGRGPSAAHPSQRRRQRVRGRAELVAADADALRRRRHRSSRRGSASSARSR